MKKHRVLLFMFLLIFAISCSDDETVTGLKEVICTGNVITAVNTTKPGVWKDGVLIVLPTLSTNNGYAYGLNIDGTDSYIYGVTRNSNNIDMPCYWKNEQRVDLPTIDGTNKGYTQSMDVKPYVSR